MSRSSRYARGLGLGYLQSALTLLVSLWMTPYLLKQVGQHDYGVWLVVSQLLLYLGLVDLGVVALLPRETAFAVGRAGSVLEAREVAAIVGRTLRVVLWQMPLLLVVLLVAYIWCPEGLSQHRAFLAVVLAVYAIRFPLRVFEATLLGLQDLAFLGILNVCIFVCSTTVIVASVAFGGGLFSLAAGWAVSQLIPPFVAWLRLARKFPHIIPKALSPVSRTDLRTLLVNGGWASTGQLAQVLVTSTDIVIIGYVGGPLAVVMYSCTARLAAVLANQPQLLIQTAQPALSEMKTGAPVARLLEVTSSLTTAVLLFSGAIACLVLASNQGFATWWVGRDLFGGLGLTVGLLVNMVLRHWNTTVVYSLFCFGRERRTCITTLLDGAAGTLLSLMLVSRFGMIGAPVAACTSVALISLPANLSALAHETGASLDRVVRGVGPWLWRFAIVFGVAYLAASNHEVFSPLGVLAGTLGIVVLYGLFMWPLLLRGPLSAYARGQATLMWRQLGRNQGAGHDSSDQSE